MTKKILFTLALIVLSTQVKISNAQNIADSAVSCFIIGATSSFQIPGGDMADRFGNNFTIGGSAFYKTKKNWLFGIDGNYMFGNDVKEEEMLNNLLTEKGTITTSEGIYGNYQLNERGLFATFRAGKIFNILAPNPNSGFFVMGGIGLLQHKIDLYEEAKSIPQIRDEYEKGYDRLSNGLAFSEFIGYWYMSNSRLLNVYGGFEFIHAVTENRRSFDFFEMRKIDEKRNDFLNSFRIGLIIPLHKRRADGFYYN